MPTQTKTDAKADSPKAVKVAASVEDTDAVVDHIIEAPIERVSRFSWRRILAYVLLPGLALLLTLGAAYLKWQDDSARAARDADTPSVQAATEGTIAMLSYGPDTADKDLTAARERMTSTFRDDYTKLTDEIVIPGAKQRHISSKATVPAAAAVSTTENHAVVLVFVNQTVTFGTDAPTNTASSVRVTLDKISGRWFISQFDPV